MLLPELKSTGSKPTRSSYFPLHLLLHLAAQNLCAVAPARSSAQRLVQCIQIVQQRCIGRFRAVVPPRKTGKL